MHAMSEVRMASFNLCNFALPGVHWHRREAGRTYTDAQWMQKRQWIAETLIAIDADIVAFQEVVSVDALRALAAEAGYAHFACATEPRFSRDDPDIYVNSTVAIASRFPITASAEIKTFETIIDQTLLDRAATYSRRPLRCAIDVPGLGETIVYAAHFKSQGALVSDATIDAIAEWDEKLDRFYVERMYAGIDQVSKRAAEAGAIYLQVREDLQGDIDRPVIVLADLNDAPGSHTLSILTQAQPIEDGIGSVDLADVPPVHRFRRYIHRLYDAYALPAHAEFERPVTFHADRRSSVLDYAIVSNGLHPQNPNGRGAVVGHAVFDAHFAAGALAATTSDHAPVIVTIRPRGTGAGSSVIGL